MCNTVREVVDHLERIVEVVLVAEEALYGKNVLVLGDWVGRQPQRSDQPRVVLTKHNEGPKFERLAALDPRVRLRAKYPKTQGGDHAEPPRAFAEFAEHGGVGRVARRGPWR